MKRLAILLFVVAGIATADSISVNNSGPGMCFAFSNISGDETNQVTLDARVDFPGVENPQPTTCVLTVTAQLITDGPKRPGILDFTLFTDPEAPGAASLFFNGVLLKSCHFVCEDLMIPVTLGDGFQITEVAPGSQGSLVDSSFYSEIDARVQALDGGSAVTLTEWITPEPGTLPLVIAGLALGSMLLRKRLPST